MPGTSGSDDQCGHAVSLPNTNAIGDNHIVCASRSGRYTDMLTVEGNGSLRLSALFVVLAQSNATCMLAKKTGGVILELTVQCASQKHANTKWRSSKPGHDIESRPSCTQA